MVDKSAVGAVGVPFPLDVDRGKIYEFAASVLADNAAYSGETPVIPPTFLTTQFFWDKWVDGANPLDLVKMGDNGMHAEQEYVFHGPPPRAGDRLVGTSRIAEIYDKQSRSGAVLTFIKMVTEFRNEAGELVAESILTGVEKQLAPKEDS